LEQNGYNPASVDYGPAKIGTILNQQP